jgi:maltose operon protein
MNRYNEATVCCSGYSDFNYEKLVIPDTKVFWLNEESKTFVFDTGKSYFKAFELPKYSSPYSISIKSYKIGQTADSFYIFSPAVMFLDERFNVTRLLSRNVLQYHAISLVDFDAAGSARALEGKITVAADNTDERYMIILTTSELLAEKTIETYPSFVPFIFPGAVGVIPTGRMNTFIIPHSPSGKIKIVINGLGE